MRSVVHRSAVLGFVMPADLQVRLLIEKGPSVEWVVEQRQTSGSWMLTVLMPSQVPLADISQPPVYLPSLPSAATTWRRWHHKRQ